MALHAARPLLILSCLASSCAPNSAVLFEQIAEGAYVAEIETPRDAALAELSTVKTSFLVPLEDSLSAHERLNLFFSRFLKGSVGKGDIYEAGGSHRGATMRKGFSSNFRYEVTSRPSPEGYRYSVGCVPLTLSADVTAAQTNARVLARFLAAGQLEENLITQ